MAKNGILIPVGVVGAIVAVVSFGWQGAFKYGQLEASVEVTEKRVGKVEVKAESNEDAVQKLASTVGSYIKVQAVKEEGRDRREALIVDLLRRKSE